MKIVLIEWVDSVRAFDWSLLEDVDEKSIDCVSVGFLLKETDNHVTIAQNYGLKPEQVCNLITIPKCSIKSIREIKEGYTWKPSDMELEVLRLAAEKDGICLMKLYEQLKKLREE